MPILTEFRIKKHSNPLGNREGAQVIEVWYDGKFRATITPGDPDVPAFRVSSTHIAGCEQHLGGVIDVYQFHLFTD